MAKPEEQAARAEAARAKAEGEKRAEQAKLLKTVIELLEKLRARRREVKGLLQKDGLEEDRELVLANELTLLSGAIKKQEEERTTLLGSIGS